MSGPSIEERYLELHREVLFDLSVRMERALTCERFEAASSLGAMVADFASRHHPGWFADAELEQAFIELGSVVPTVKSTTPRMGHAHLVEASASAAVFGLADAMLAGAPNGGQVVVVEPGASPLERAIRLRAEIDWAEVVFLHTEPQAIEMAIALAGWKSRPAVVVVNHHETVFWSGAGVADVMVSHTATGRARGIDRRFVSPARSLLMPKREASVGAWEHWIARVDELATTVHPAWLPGACLPVPTSQGDLEIVGMQRGSGRSDGVSGSWFRNGRNLAEPDRPPLSVVVVGRDGQATVECLHDALDAWGGSATPQLIVVDTGSDPALGPLVQDLKGLVLHVPVDVRAGEDPGEAGLRWCWAAESVLLDDTSRPDHDLWAEALADLGDPTGPGIVKRAGRAGSDQLFFRTELVTVGASFDTVGENTSDLVTP
ncbi:MAG: hypothetical protein GY925_15385 [Actinomycetia bacterium]|nr:hypothetical protein [Actinomycetes bacterium]